MRIAPGTAAPDDIGKTAGPADTARVTRASLVCHPDTPSAAVRRIEARVARAGSGMLSLTYEVAGDLDRALVPPPQTPRRGEKLWEHTCFEVFVRLPGREAYHELNFAPSRAWAAFAFDRYRAGAALADGTIDPQIVVRSGEGRLMLEVTIALAGLSKSYTRSRLALGLTAVIEDRDGALSYWALAHPPGKPDFHHPQGYALELDETRD
jgi:hypothetical protein